MNRMKTILILAVLTACNSATPAIGLLPGYLPSAPPPDKAVVDYSVADVMGVVCTNWSKLPEGQPPNKKELGDTWPGAKVATNIDQFLGYLLLAPDAADEKVLSDNLYWILHEIIDVPNAEKASAILRVYSAQNDAAKRRRIAMFSGKVFPYLLDVRLLALVRDLLDDNTVLRTSRPEGAEPRVVTARNVSKRMCRNYVLGKGFLEVEMMGSDYIDIFREAASEEESCQRFKQWMTDHWGEITTKTGEAIAKPNRSYRKPIIRVFDPR